MRVKDEKNLFLEVEEAFSVETMVEKTAEVYESVVTEKLKGSRFKVRGSRL